MKPRHGRALLGLGALTITLTGVLTGCGGSDTPEAPRGTTAQDVGWARIAYPQGWTVLNAAQRPQGWDWAAQPDATEQAAAQIAVDGDYSRMGDVGLSSAQLLAGAQVGGFPEFEVGDQGPAKIPGAVEATRINFTYVVKGVKFDGVWIVARASDDRTVAVQVTGKRPLSDTLVDQTVAGLGVTDAGQGDGGKA
jgi:hypothetical protein